MADDRSREHSRASGHSPHKRALPNLGHICPKNSQKQLFYKSFLKNFINNIMLKVKWGKLI